MPPGYWELSEPGRRFERLSSLKSWLKEHGEVGRVYDLIRYDLATAREQGCYCIVALREYAYCPVCSCVRRERKVVEKAAFKPVIGPYGNRHVRVDPKECRNPACQLYHRYLDTKRPTVFGRCANSGCKKTAVAGQPCPICGGPDFNLDPSDFNAWACDTGIRVSTYPELRDMLFLGGEQKHWLIDDTRDPPRIPSGVRGGVLTEEEKKVREEILTC